MHVSASARQENFIMLPLWHALIALHHAWHAQIMPVSAHNVESVIFSIFMKINAWLIALMDSLKIQLKTNAKNV